MTTEKAGLLNYLAKEEKPDRNNDQGFLDRFYKNIGQAFLEVDASIEKGEKNEYFLKGGRGSLKSSFIAMEIIKMLRYKPRNHAIVFRKVGNTMRDTVYSQMEWAVDKLGVGDEWECTVSPMRMINKKTRQKILFKGLDDPDKLKSIKTKRGVFEAVWFEEGAEYRDYDEIKNIMQSAGRGKNANTVAFISYNPDKDADHWLNKEALEKEPMRMVHYSSYLMAPPEWLGNKFLKLAQSTKERNEREYRHAYLGESIGSESSVFNNLVIRKITKQERELMRPIYIGMDFGYSKDPSAIMDVYYAEEDSAIYLLNEFYKQGAGYDLLEKEIKKRTKDGNTVSSDTLPLTVAELRNRGCKVDPARKGKNSRVFGFMWLEGLSAIVIDPESCPNAATEFQGFKHPKDEKTGRVRADYPDGDDHTIDATRYALWRIIFKNRRKKFFSGKGAV